MSTGTSKHGGNLNSAQPRVEQLRAMLGAAASATVGQLLTLAEQRLSRRAFTIDMALAALAEQAVAATERAKVRDYEQLYRELADRVRAWQQSIKLTKATAVLPGEWARADAAAQAANEQLLGVQLDPDCGAHPDQAGAAVGEQPELAAQADQAGSAAAQQRRQRTSRCRGSGAVITAGAADGALKCPHCTASWGVSLPRSKWKVKAHRPGERSYERKPGFSCLAIEPVWDEASTEIVPLKLDTDAKPQDGHHAP